MSAEEWVTDVCSVVKEDHFQEVQCALNPQWFPGDLGSLLDF